MDWAEEASVLLGLFALLFLAAVGSHASLPSGDWGQVWGLVSKVSPESLVLAFPRQTDPSPGLMGGVSPVRSSSPPYSPRFASGKAGEAVRGQFHILLQSEMGFWACSSRQFDILCNPGRLKSSSLLTACQRGIEVFQSKAVVEF